MDVFHTLTFDILDFYQVAQNQPFSIRVRLRRSRDGLVTLTFAGTISFVLPDSHTDPIPPQVPLAEPGLPSSFPVPPGGQLTLVEGFLPEGFRPNDTVGVSSILEGEQTGPQYLMLIQRDGNLRVVAPGNASIATAGVQVLHPKSVLFEAARPQRCFPPNFALSLAPSQAYKFQGFALVKQWYDLYIGDIYDGFFASRWADNSTTSKAPYNFNVYTRTGRMVEDCDARRHARKHRHKDESARVSLQRAPVVAFEAALDWFFTQGSISINPTDPRNLVWTALLIRNDLIRSVSSSNPDQLQLWRGVSRDGGDTWSVVDRIDSRDPIPHAYSDSYGLFDRFGNHWITSTFYAPGDGIYPSRTRLLILVSSDGGATYRVAYEPSLPNQASLDFNQIAFGGDGNGGWALWFVNDYILLDGTFAGPTINYIPTSGRGQFGAGVTVVLSTLGAVGAGLSTLAVSDDGDIFLYYEFFGSAAELSATGAYGLAYHLGGRNDLVDGSFTDLGTFQLNGLDFLVEGSPGVGSQYGIHSSAIRAAPDQPIQGLQYDNRRKVLFALAYDFAPVYTQDMTLYLVATRDGRTWSAPYVVRDTVRGNVNRPSFKQDPVRGPLYITSYDSRRSEDSLGADFFGVIVDNPTLDRIVSTLPRGHFRRVPASASTRPSGATARLARPRRSRLPTARMTDADGSRGALVAGRVPAPPPSGRPTG